MALREKRGSWDQAENSGTCWMNTEGLQSVSFTRQMAPSETSEHASVTHVVILYSAVSVWGRLHLKHTHDTLCNTVV